MENQAVAKTAPPPVGEKWLRVSKTLESWIPTYDLPRGITPDVLYMAAADARQALEPAGGELFAVIIDRLFRFAETFAIKDAGIRDAMRFYVEALDDVPPDLLERAVDNVVRNYKYGHRMPPPADLRAVVEQDMAARANALARIETAQKFGKYDKPYEPPSDADKERVAQILADAKKSLEVPE